MGEVIKLSQEISRTGSLSLQSTKPPWMHWSLSWGSSRSSRPHHYIILVLSLTHSLSPVPLPTLSRSPQAGVGPPQGLLQEIQGVPLPLLLGKALRTGAPVHRKARKVQDLVLMEDPDWTLAWDSSPTAPEGEGSWGSHPSLPPGPGFKLGSRRSQTFQCPPSLPQEPATTQLTPPPLKSSWTYTWLRSQTSPTARMLPLKPSPSLRCTPTLWRTGLTTWRTCPPGPSCWSPITHSVTKRASQSKCQCLINQLLSQLLWQSQHLTKWPKYTLWTELN